MQPFSRDGASGRLWITEFSLRGHPEQLLISWGAGRSEDLPGIVQGVLMGARKARGEPFPAQQPLPAHHRRADKAGEGLRAPEEAGSPAEDGPRPQICPAPEPCWRVSCPLHGTWSQAPRRARATRTAPGCGVAFCPVQSLTILHLGQAHRRGALAGRRPASPQVSYK